MKLGKMVKNLRLSSNMVLAVKAGSEIAKVEILDGIQKAVAGTNLENIIIVVVDDLGDITALPEAEMNKHGWYHVAMLKRVIHMERVPGHSGSEGDNERKEEAHCGDDE